MSDIDKGIGYFVENHNKILISRHYYSVRHGSCAAFAWSMKFINQKIGAYVGYMSRQTMGESVSWSLGRGLDRDVPDCGY